MSTSPTTRSSAWAKAIQLSFLAGDLGGALRIAEDAAEDVAPLELLDEVIAPALRDVGVLWERDMISPADEHLATATAHRLLAVVAPRLRTAEPGSRGRLAVLATPEPERHTTGLLMAEDVLRGAGYTVKALGGGVPLPALLRFAEREQPAVVGLSATMAFPAELLETIDGLRSVCPARILVGGSSVPDAVAEHGAERVGDLRELAAALAL